MTKFIVVACRPVDTTQAARRKRGLNPAAVDDPAKPVYIQCIYMATSTQIAKWGNSLGLRLPKSVALEAQLDEGDTVEVSVKNGTIVVSPTRPTYSLDALVARITPRNRHGQTGWGSPVGREPW